MSGGHYLASPPDLSDRAVRLPLLDIKGRLRVALDSIAGALGPTTPSLSLSVVAAQSQPWTWIVPVTSTPRALIIAWVLSTAYAVGEIVTNDTGKVYQCITAGTSAGSGGPTGTAADITDGTVHWKYIAAAVVTFNGGITIQNKVGSANALSWSATASTLAAGGKEIVIGTDGEQINYGNATSIWLYSSGTATASIVGYP